MSVTPERSELPVDNEFVEDWILRANFRTGSLTLAELRAMGGRDEASRRGQELFTTLHDGDLGVTSLITSDMVRGTQYDVLRQTCVRYVSVLGALALPGRLLVARMNVGAVSEAILEPYGLDKYPVLPQDFETFEPMTEEEWNRMDEAPESLTLDVTESMRRVLGSQLC